MPSFCRHGRLTQNCVICTREQGTALRPVVTGGEVASAEPRPAARLTPATPRSGSAPATGRSRSGARPGGMTVRRLAREADDGYSSTLVPGIRSEADAERLAQELAFATARLQVLESDPPGLYAEVADSATSPEERTWLALQIAAIGPQDSGEADGDPFASIAAARTTWASGENPDPEQITPGPRTGLPDAAKAARLFDAYRAWTQRAGSQAAAFGGDDTWTPERRFDRIFERLGSQVRLDRDARYDLLVTLGRLGVYELRGTALHVGGGDRVTIAAKRILGIGDPMLLQRRAADLAEAAGVPFEAVDLGFFNWERGSRTGDGIDPDTELDDAALQGARGALGLR
jgi:hypothetical protein